jgi:hypothetical protein
MADQVVDDLHDSDDEDEVDGRPSKLRVWSWTPLILDKREKVWDG